MARRTGAMWLADHYEVGVQRGPPRVFEVRTLSDGGEAVSVEVVEGAVTNLHSLADTLRALRRLLDQKEGDGASIGADPALVQAVIVAGHEEMRSVRTLLAGVQPAEPWVQAANALARATSETDDLLDALEEAVRVAKN